MEHLLSRLKLKCLEKGVALLFDYDGTLAPIVKSPELAALSHDTRVLLERLAKRYPVAIITGRSLTDIKKLVGLKKIYYAGNHGFEISGPKIQLVLPQAEHAYPVISKLCAELKNGLKHISDAIVEDKGSTASVHYRLVAWRELPALKNIFWRIVKSYVNSGKVRVTRGKKVFEIRPNIEWGKGKAVLWVIDAIDPKKTLIPVYLGDDQTDEDAFLALKRRGITILISEKRKRSHAKFYLKNVGEVKTFLKKLGTMKYRYG
jgi:trehalose-phosphatase